MKRWTVLLPLCACMLWTAVPAEAGGGVTVVVDENDMEWGFLEEIADGTGSFTYGPNGDGSQGEGAAQLTVDATGRHIFGTAKYNGLLLSNIVIMQYDALRLFPSTGVTQTSLQINVDYDSTDMDLSWQGRLVYEPYLNGTVDYGRWQIWSGTSGNWWASGAPGNTECPQNSPCTWTEILNLYPNAAIHSELGAVLFKAGGPWAEGFRGLVDKFSFFTPETTNLYDFETINGIFADGFESGDTTSWTSTLP